MTREFQVLYRLTAQAEGAGASPVSVPVGAVLATLAQAEGEDQIRAQFAAAGLQVVGINFVRPVVDWSKPVFDQDEAAAYFGWKNSTLSSHKGSGNIPFTNANGAPRFIRAHLDRYLLENSNAAGKELARKS